MHTVLEYIRRELGLRLELGPDEVLLDSAAVLSDESDTRGAVISLVNTRVSAYQSGGLARPDLLDSLELFVLFAFRFRRYDVSLYHLYRTIRLLHAKPVYSAADSHPDNPFPTHVKKLSFTLCPLEFDALSDLWGMLGGVMIPSVLYSVRIVRTQRV